MMEQKIITFEEEIAKVKSILAKETITEEEKYYLTSFTKNMGLRQIIYSNDMASDTMQKELKSIIDTIPNSPETSAKKYFINSYNDFYLKEVQNNTNSQSHSNGLSQEKAYVRVRTDGIHTSSTNNDDINIPNNSSGFSNILLILISSITCGIILGLLLINYIN